MSSAMLRPGLHDFSYEAGFLRKDFGRRSNAYGGFMVSGTHRYGVGARLTGEVHAEASARRQLVSAGATMLLGDKAMVSVTGAASLDSGRTGRLAAISIERQTQGLSFGASAEATSRHFGGVWLTSNYRLPRRTVTAHVSAPFGPVRVAANYIDRKFQKEERLQLLGMSASLPLGRLGVLGFSGMRSMSGRRSTSLEMFLSMPLGSHINAGVSVQRDGGRQSATASIQRSAPTDQGFGYQAAISTGALNRAEGRINYESGNQSYEVGVAHLAGRTAYRGGVRGSLSLLGGKLAVGRSLTDSFAVVDAGHAGVRVYHDHTLVGRTGRSGRIIVPRLRSYDENSIRIEQGDLPVDAQIDNMERIVRPYARNGLRIDYRVEPSFTATLTLVDEDGKPLQSGAWARVEGKTDSFVIAPGGETYLAGLKATNRVLVAWEGGSCGLDLTYRPGQGPQPDLGRQICRRISNASP
jgi:outer membrane usher protein